MLAVQNNFFSYDVMVGQRRPEDTVSSGRLVAFLSSFSAE
jgi:hypothetical protein